MMPPLVSTEIKQGTEAEATTADAPVEADTTSTENQRVVAVSGDAPDVPVDGNAAGVSPTTIHDKIVASDSQAPPPQPPISEETTQEVEISVCVSEDRDASGEWLGCGVVQSDGYCRVYFYSDPISGRAESKHLL